METTIIPIQFKAAAPKKIDIIPTGKIGKLEFAKMSVKDGDTDVNVTEDHLEEFVRRHVDLVFSQEEEETEQTLLIVGQQVRDKEGRRSDLVALDSEGCVLLIEIKRDRKDMEARKEPLEFQAVRYAANYALITTPEDLVDKLFAPYIKKHWDEYHEHHKTETQLGREILEGFLTGNKIEELDFNQRQRIVLIASDFDDETLSACAWLCKNKVELALSNHLAIQIQRPILPKDRTENSSSPVGQLLRRSGGSLARCGESVDETQGCQGVFTQDALVIREKTSQSRGQGVHQGFRF